MSREHILREVKLLKDGREEDGRTGRKLKAMLVFLTMFLLALVPVTMAWFINNPGDVTESLDEDQTPETQEDNEIVPFTDGPDTEVTELPPSIPPAVEASYEAFGYDWYSRNDPALGAESGFLGSSGSEIIIMNGKGPSNKSKGGKLGNAPEALYNVLEKFLAKGKAPPPNFPVPYVVYTKSDGDVEKVTDILTKQPCMINVDDVKATGQGHKDIRVKTTIDVDPLVMTTTIERLGNTHPTYLEVLVTFPAFFYNGEAGDPDGEPYWSYGYTTEPGSEIPEEITMTFTVDKSLGSEHIFKFDWVSESGIDPLKFTMGTFQVQNKDIDSPIYPAFSEFVVSSPPWASLTFETDETDDYSLKCMNWSAPMSFYLTFGFLENETIMGNDVIFDMDVTVDSVPQSFSFCMAENRAANTFTVDYIASSPVDLIDVTTEIVVEAVATVTINLLILDMPAEFHATMGDGYLDVDVLTNVGFVGLNATADLGLAAIASMLNVRLMIWDLPNFSATWFQDDTGNGFSLEAASCIGQIEFAFSFGDLMFPAEHDGDPDSHYLFAYSDPSVTAIALRLIELSLIEFSQDNEIADNSLEVNFCGNYFFYILAHTEVGSLLTEDHDVELRIEVDVTPTEMTLLWTVPFTFALLINEPIDSIVGDLTYDDLVAHVEILDIPDDMGWTIDPAGSFLFLALGPIGTILITVSHPDGIPGAETFFAGEPIRLFYLNMEDVPSFVAAWSSEDATPWTAVSWNTAFGTSLGELTFAISTSETDWAGFILIFHTNRALFYNDDSLNLGNGLVMEASLYMHVEDMSRAEFAFGGEVSTIDIGFGATVSHNLIATTRLHEDSGLNPAEPRRLVATVMTTDLPTSMDLTVTPEESFVYTANAGIEMVFADATIGTTTTEIHIEIEGLPASAEGDWRLKGNGHFDLTMSDRLDRIWVVMDDPDGLFGSNFIHADVLILDIPESIESDWDIGDKEFTLSFTDGTYDEGLGEFRFLITTDEETPTENYINSLATGSSCMTEYTDYTETIDDRYWPNTVPSRLDDLYCRHPTLNPGADDYALYRTGYDGVDDITLYAIRVRELALLDLKLKRSEGFVDLEFSRNVALARQFYFISDNFDTDKMTLAEISALPDGQSTNSFFAEWDKPDGHYAYDLSEVIPYIDAYYGERESDSLTSDYVKLVLRDVPSEVSLDYELEFGSSGEGYIYFVASSTWEAGILYQHGGWRYVAWLQMRSLWFDYSYAGPGEESCDHGYKWEVCYRVFRLDLVLDADVEADGILGIYDRKNDPKELVHDDPSPSPGDQEYIPQWTFILDNFDILELHPIWDIWIGADPVALPPYLDVGWGVLPHIDIVADLHLMIDYFWNKRYSIDLLSVWVPGLPNPLIPGCCEWDVKIRLNKYQDYRDQKPIHLWPLDLEIDEFPLTFGIEHDYHDLIYMDITFTINVPGFHRKNDHRTPFT